MIMKLIKCMKTVKQSFLVMLIMLFCLNNVSCSKDNNKDPLYISCLSGLLLKDLEFGPKNGKQILHFPDQDLSKLTITSDAIWCSPWVDYTNHRIIVEVVSRGEAEENSEKYEKERICIVTITDVVDKSFRSFKVTQQAK